MVGPLLIARRSIICVLKKPALAVPVGSRIVLIALQ